jgi:transposase-like protein
VAAGMKVIYTESKVPKNRLAFATAEAAMKLCYMAMENIPKKWTMPIKHWSQALMP